MPWCACYPTATPLLPHHGRKRCEPSEATWGRVGTSAGATVVLARVALVILVVVVAIAVVTAVVIVVVVVAVIGVGVIRVVVVVIAAVIGGGRE